METVSEIKTKRLAYVAVEVSDFVSSLPDYLDCFIFKQIFNNGYAICNIVKDKKEAVIQLVRAVCYSFGTEEEIQSLLKEIVGYTSLEQLNEIENIRQNIVTNGFFLDREVLFLKLLGLINGQEMPDPTCLFHLSSVFQCKPVGNEWKDSTRSYLEKKLSIWADDESDLSEEKSEFQSNWFAPLAFQTFLTSYAYAEKTTRQFDILFYHWFCKGEILDIIIDTIANSPSHFIACELMDRLVNWSKKSKNLATVTQERYDHYRSYSTKLPIRHFNCTEEDEITICKPGQVAALPKIEGINDKTMYKDGLKVLHFLLNDSNGEKKQIKCAPEQFCAAFSGEGHYTDRIEWKGTQIELTAFFRVLYKGPLTTECRQNIVRVFRKDDGTECSPVTLKQWKENDKNKRLITKYEEFFRQSGFIR